MLKVLFLHTSTATISWYRMIQPAQKMMEFDDIHPIYPHFDVEKADRSVRSFENHVQESLETLGRLFEVADIVVAAAVHTTEFGCALKALKEYYKKPLILEMDDHPFAIGGEHPNFKEIGVNSNIERDAYDQARDSDAVICSTEYLARVFMANRVREVHVVPNAIDMSTWGPLEAKRSHSHVVLGWSGAMGHEKDLSIVKPVFELLLDEFPKLEIRCLHGAEGLIDHERFSNKFTWCNIFDYPQKLAEIGFDIAVAPLWDSEFNRAKSNLRYLEYSALKIPTVASNVEPYRKTITDGVDGFLASTKNEWVDKLRKLIIDSELRASIRGNAHKLVVEKYEARQIARDYADLLISLHGKFKQGASSVHVCSNPI